MLKGLVGRLGHGLKPSSSKQTKDYKKSVCLYAPVYYVMDTIYILIPMPHTE